MFRAINSDSKPRFSHLGYRVAVVCGLTFSVIGCGTGPQAEFKFRETTEDLIPETLKSVKTTMRDAFGTPSELIAWERFPIAYGGVKGTVASVDGSSGTVSVTLESEPTKVASGAPVLWFVRFTRG